MARKMKDSGIEWIGEIPEGWEIVKIKYGVTKVGSGKTPSGGAEVYTDCGVLFLRSQNIYDCSLVLDNPSYISYETDLTMKSTRILPNDILLNITGASIGRCCVVPETLGPANVNQHVCIIRTNPEFFLPKFMQYFWVSHLGRYAISLFQTGGNREGLSFDAIRNTPIPYISIPEQSKIITYLDSECSRIDVMLSKTRSSIEEYKKLKQAVITQAATKGVRGEREMKDSGVEWIGEIPKEWDIIKSSRIIKTTQNGLSRRDLEKSEGQIILKLKNITSDGKIDYSFLNRITLSQNELNTYALTTGDFLFVRVNGSKSLVGKCAIFEAISEIVAYNDHIIRVKLSNQCYNRFFLWYLYSCCGKAEIDLHTSTAAGQYTISGDGLRDITLVFPPIDEQKEIADYLDAKCAEIDKLIAKKEQLVKELESYKKSLIYEVVTGKREV